MPLHGTAPSRACDKLGAEPGVRTSQGLLRNSETACKLGTPAAHLSVGEGGLEALHAAVFRTAWWGGGPGRGAKPRKHLGCSCPQAGRAAPSLAGGDRAGKPASRRGQTGGPSQREPLAPRSLGMGPSTTLGRGQDGSGSLRTPGGWRLSKKAQDAGPAPRQEKHEPPDRNAPGPLNPLVCDSELDGRAVVSDLPVNGGNGNVSSRSRSCWLQHRHAHRFWPAQPYASCCS